MSIKKLIAKLIPLMAIAVAILIIYGASDEGTDCDQPRDLRVFSKNFSSQDCDFANRYAPGQRTNPYLILEPGWRLTLVGEDDSEAVQSVITVLDETELVDGVETRVVEEREWVNGELDEVSRSFYAICRHTNDIYLFGEEEESFANGVSQGVDESWRAGVNGARPGLYIPGSVLVGARYCQENAPGEAEDRVEVIDIAAVELFDRQFHDVVILHESSPGDDPCDTDVKYLAPEIGLIRDEALYLAKAEFAFQAETLKSPNQ